MNEEKGEKNRSKEEGMFFKIEVRGRPAKDKGKSMSTIKFPEFEW